MKWKLTKWGKIACATAGLFVLCNLLLLASPHHVRLSLRRIIEIRDASFFNAPPATAQSGQQVESTVAESTPRFPIPSPLKDQPLGAEKAIGILMYYGEMASRASRNSGRLPESPGTLGYMLLERRLRGTCYDDSILCASILRREGFEVRLADLAGNDGLGGAGHNIVEVWDGRAGAWMFFDPQQAAYCRIREGRILSALDLRTRVLRGATSDIEIVQGNGFKIPKEKLLEFYRLRIADVLFYCDTEYVLAPHQTCASAVSHWIQLQNRVLGAAAVPVGQTVGGMLTMRVRRHRLVDEFNPKSYHPSAWFFGYRAAVLVVLVVLVIAWNPAKYIRPDPRRPDGMG